MYVGDMMYGVIGIILILIYSFYQKRQRSSTLEYLWLVRQTSKLNKQNVRKHERWASATPNPTTTLPVVAACHPVITSKSKKDTGTSPQRERRTAARNSGKPSLTPQCQRPRPPLLFRTPRAPPSTNPHSPRLKGQTVGPTSARWSRAGEASAAKGKAKARAKADGDMTGPKPLTS
jgi:hypothetical protein